MENKIYVKFLDENIANVLCEGGFSYIKQNVNNKEVYAFELTDDLEEYIQECLTKKKFKFAGYMIDDKLTF